MAKVRKNIVIHGLSSSLGDQLVIKQDKGGRTIVAVKPTLNPNRSFSEAQKEVQDNFREAAAYAKTAKTQQVYVDKAQGLPQSGYNLAVADWFHAPEILEMDASAWHGGAGQVIRVKAIDDVQVTQVNIVIMDASNTVLEQGQAVAAGGLWWNYTTTASAPEAPQVIASARDLPGHIAEFHWQEPS